MGSDDACGTAEAVRSVGKGIENGEANDCNAVRKEFHKTKRHKYRMPKQYAAFITKLLQEKPGLDRALGQELMFKEFGLTDVQVPLYFPTEDQVLGRIIGMKYRMQKKRKMKHPTVHSYQNSS